MFSLSLSSPRSSPAAPLRSLSPHTAAVPRATLLFSTFIGFFLKIGNGNPNQSCDSAAAATVVFENLSSCRPFRHVLGQLAMFYWKLSTRYLRDKVSPEYEFSLVISVQRILNIFVAYSTGNNEKKSSLLNYLSCLYLFLESQNIYYRLHSFARYYISSIFPPNDK